MHQADLDAHCLSRPNSYSQTLLWERYSNTATKTLKYEQLLLFIYSINEKSKKLDFFMNKSMIFSIFSHFQVKIA